jgi:hypothetical protein
VFLLLLDSLPAGSARDKSVQPLIYFSASCASARSASGVPASWFFPWVCVDSVFSHAPWFAALLGSDWSQFGSVSAAVELPDGGAPRLNFCVWFWLLQVDASWFLSYRIKSSRFPSFDHSQSVAFQTRPQYVRWNVCEDMNWVFVRFLSSILHVFLPTSICVFAVVPNTVPRVDSFSIAMWSWPS